MHIKKHFFLIFSKKNFFTFIFLSFSFLLLIFTNTNLIAVKNGLTLWATTVVPSLFPFFVATNLLMHTNIVFLFEKLFNKFMKPIFNINGKGAFCFIMGLISGYPLGAKIVTNFRENNICSKIECERLLSFTNNSGPLFILSTVGISMFGNTTIGILLLLTHILASLTVGFIFRYYKKNDSREYISNIKNNYNYVSFSNLGEVLNESILSSINSILTIGGFVVIFSSILSILKSSGILNILVILLSPIFNILHIDTNFISPFITGFFEITNGINLISNIKIKNISINIVFTAFLLGFGGISVLLQVWSIISKTDLSIKPYIIGKLLHGIIAAFYSFLFINFFSFFNFNL